MSKITKGSGNVYADLGMADADEMLVKAQLAAKISEIIKLRKLTQTQASALLGMTQPKLSNMLRGRFRGISETKMLECLTLLGSDVQIVVKPFPVRVRPVICRWCLPDQVRHNKAAPREKSA